jgi:hypothetical protein
MATLRIVGYFLQKGANMCLHVPQVGSVLQIMAVAGNYSTVKLLVESGAYINAQGGGYGTALTATVSNSIMT